MNATQLKNRAARLLARLNALGITKTGKPLVIDQVYELVAAEEGYRNQHVLRQNLADPRETSKAEAQGRQQWLDACNAAHWNRDSEISHLEGFIAERGLMAEFGAYAMAAAKEERGLCADQIPGEAVIDALKALGFDVKRSEFYAPYWEFEDHASDDFDDEDQAWASAWVHAQGRTLEQTGTPFAVWEALPVNEQLARVQQHLAEAPEDLIRRLANEAFENHDFGAELTVVASNGWETSTGSNAWVRTVFLRDSANPAADSVKHRFTVVIEGSQVDRISVDRG